MILWLLLLFPILYPLFAKLVFKKTFTWIEVLANVVLVVIFVLVVYFVSKSKDTSDFMIYTGKITNKERIHDSYVESYRCNCYTTRHCSGSGSNRSCYSSEHCSTCYRTVYTVDWKVVTTLGKRTLYDINSYSRSVYKKPDPSIYTQSYINEPYHEQIPFTNWVKGSPYSLFNQNTLLSKTYETKIPEYPSVYETYHYDRIITVGNVSVNKKLLNELLSNYLKELKNKNVIIILTDIVDTNFKYVVENKWFSGKLNDTVIYIGLNKDNTVIWTDVSTWIKNTGNEIYVAELKTNLLNLQNKKFDEKDLFSKLNVNNFKRQNENKFKYLEDEYTPSKLAIIICVILEIIFSVGLSILFHKNEFTEDMY